MRHASTVQRGAVLAATVLLLAAPSTAHAQLGGLRKRIGQQVERTVLGEPSRTGSAAPAFSDRVLEITDARIAQMLAGLRAEQVQAEREARALAAEDARDRQLQERGEAHAQCAEPFARAKLRDASASMALSVVAQREQQAKGAVSPAVRDSLAAVVQRLARADSSLQAKCGEAPERPAFVVVDDDGEAPSAEEIGAQAARLSEEQYAVMRERLAAYVQGRGRGVGRYVFTPEELAALQTRMGELAAYEKLLAS